MHPLTLDYLAELVSFDTCNPPRRIDQGGIFAFAAGVLAAAGFEVTLDGLGDGCVNLLATRGVTRRLLNVHLDTVPVGEGWTADPFRLSRRGGRVIGRGTTDIKGAAAALLAAARRTAGPGAILLTSDEEAGDGRCVRTFLRKRGSAFDEVIVAEPTACRLVDAHRGIVSGVASFSGVAVHAAQPDAFAVNALHRAVKWAGGVLDDAEAAREVRFNLGSVEGGIKPNVTASSARLRFGLRPWTLEADRWWIDRLASGIAAHGGQVEFVFRAPPLTGSPLPDAGARARHGRRPI